MKKSLSALGFILLFVGNVFAFNDVNNAHKNNQAIEYLKDKQVIQGYADGTFKPENEINRAEMIKILVEGKGIKPTTETFKNCFPDVNEEWFAPYVCYAKSNKWIGGYPDGSFKPSQTVSKVESLKMILNAFDVPLSNIAGSNFSDVNAGDWFAPYVRTAKEKGLLEENSIKFDPATPQSRARVSENLFRTMVVKEKKVEKFSSELLGEIKEIVKEEVQIAKEEIQEVIKNTAQEEVIEEVKVREEEKAEEVIANNSQPVVEETAVEESIQTESIQEEEIVEEKEPCIYEFRGTTPSGEGYILGTTCSAVTCYDHFRMFNEQCVPDIEIPEQVIVFAKGSNAGINRQAIEQQYLVDDEIVYAFNTKDFYESSVGEVSYAQKPYHISSGVMKKLRLRNISGDNLDGEMFKITDPRGMVSGFARMINGVVEFEMEKLYWNDSVTWTIKTDNLAEDSSIIYPAIEPEFYNSQHIGNTLQLELFEVEIGDVYLDWGEEFKNLTVEFDRDMKGNIYEILETYPEDLVE